MAAVAAGHLSRGLEQHQLPAASHYSLALQGLTDTLSDPTAARSDATLGACLLLCVYEVGFNPSFRKCQTVDETQMSHSGSGLWLSHLQGARDLIFYRGGLRTADYLTRFFSLLDVSGSMFAGVGPLLDVDYLLDDEFSAISRGDKQNG